MGARLGQYDVVGVLLLRHFRRMRFIPYISCVPFVLSVVIRRFPSNRIVLVVCLVSVIYGLVCDPSSRRSIHSISWIPFVL